MVSAEDGMVVISCLDPDIKVGCQVQFSGERLPTQLRLCDGALLRGLSARERAPAPAQ